MQPVTSKKLQVTGTVLHGDGFGKVLGYPTANIDRKDYSRRKLDIKLGIWAGVVINYQLSIISYYHAAIVIGPVDSRGLPKIEAHLLGFKGNLYGKKITLELKKYLRPFKKFKNIETLKKQICKDVNKAKLLKYD